MSSTRPRATGIPRLQEIEFLVSAATAVAENRTYDEIRRALIERMAAQREAFAPSGNHAAIRLARHDEHRYMSNATEALSELMRLGLVERAQLPTTRSAAGLYAKRTFLLTDDGRRWVAQIETPGERRTAFDELLKLLWNRHPQLVGFLRVLEQGMFTVPIANWGDVHRTPVGPEGREAYLRYLAARATRAVNAGATTWKASEDEIVSALHEYIRARMASAERRQRPDPYLRNRDFVNACEEALVTFAFREAGVTLDYISHEILRRWGKQFGVANFSYHVPAAHALRLWLTATLEIDSNGQLVAIHRRAMDDWGDRVIDELQPAFELARQAASADSFVPIYRVRAAVCSKLGLNDVVFDTAVQEFLRGDRRRDAPFAMNADIAEFGSTPPTETPLRVQDKEGRQRVFRTMTLIPRS